MNNPKTFLIANSSTNQAIEILKEECTPKGDFATNKKCGVMAGVQVLDDWDDPCEGHECLKEDGHTGKHMASDGANGWVYWGDNLTLNDPKILEALATWKFPQYCWYAFGKIKYIREHNFKDPLAKFSESEKQEIIKSRVVIKPKLTFWDKLQLIFNLSYGRYKND